MLTPIGTRGRPGRQVGAGPLDGQPCSTTGPRPRTNSRADRGTRRPGGFARDRRVGRQHRPSALTVLARNLKPALALVGQHPRPSRGSTRPRTSTSNATSSSTRSAKGPDSPRWLAQRAQQAHPLRPGPPVRQPVAGVRGDASGPSPSTTSAPSRGDYAAEPIAKLIVVGDVEPEALLVEMLEARPSAPGRPPAPRPSPVPPITSPRPRPGVIYLVPISRARSRASINVARTVGRPEGPAVLRH